MKDPKTRYTKPLKELHKTKGHLEFFIDRSSETTERMLSTVQQLQQEIRYLKESLSEARNKHHNKKQSCQQPDVHKTTD